MCPHFHHSVWHKQRLQKDLLIIDPAVDADKHHMNMSIIKNANREAYVGWC